MKDSVKEYKRRRAKRIQDCKGEKRYDSVEAYRERRAQRLREREDAGIGWAYGLAQSKGIDAQGMTPKEVFEALKEKGMMPGKGTIGDKTSVVGAQSGKKTSTGKVVPKSKNDRRRQECDGLGYKGKAGEVRTGLGGKLAPKTVQAKVIDTADAIAETELYKSSHGAKGLKENSLSQHIDKNGKLTPERQKVHDEIVQNFFSQLRPYSGKATMIMSGGGPASGKSFVSDGAKKELGADTVVVVDPDVLKAKLPGFADMAISGDKAAGYYHEESSALAKRIYQYACDNNINVVYDGTGDGSVNSVKKKLALAQKSGYAVRGEYVTVNVEGASGAIARNQSRYEHAKRDWDAGKEDMDPPRCVGVKHLRDIHAAVSDIAPDVANLFDEWVLTDNNVPKGAQRPVIAKCSKGGEIRVVKGMEQKVQDWLDKGKRGGKVENGRIVFPK